MADIVMADWGLAFNGQSLRDGPLGGSESAFICLAEALAAHGHTVAAYTRGGRTVDLAGVRWRDAEGGLPKTADLFLANRSEKVLRAVPGARRVALWVHNPAGYLLKWRYLWKLALRRPALVFLSRAHAATLPAWVPAGGRVVVPHGIGPAFRGAARLEAPPPPRAIFVSSPLHGLDWVLDVWAAHVHPQNPAATLDLYSGAATYGADGERAARMAAVLDRAQGMVDQGVRLNAPVTKDRLAGELRRSRVLLYRGEPGEAFCLAVAEAQAMGVPTVVTDVGGLAERVRDGITGRVVGGRPEERPAAFGAAALRLLGDDALWRDQHHAALDLQGGWGWDEAAAAFERLLGEI
jgi:glycosyltransferase involved in cell wall biosynthesis